MQNEDFRVVPAESNKSKPFLCPSQRGGKDTLLWLSPDLDPHRFLLLNFFLG